MNARDAILRELSQRVGLSAGPEVFRRLTGLPAEEVDAALDELVREGVLKRTDLRVGVIYHYPPNRKPSLDLLDEKLAEPQPEAPRATRPPASRGS